MQVITSLGSFGSKKVYQNDRNTSSGCMMQFESASANKRKKERETRTM
jgi:hypothetical protein